MVSINLPAAMGTWTIEDMIEGEAGINLYKAEKHTDQGQVLSLVKIIPIPENNDVMDELMEEEGCREAAELRLRIMLDSYVQNIKQQEKMRACPNILGVEEYAVEKRPESAGWILYERTAFAESLDVYIYKREKAVDAVRLGQDICKALECCEKTGLDIHSITKGQIYHNGDMFLLGKLDNNITDAYNSFGLKVGTLLYLAPELQKGQADHRSAIYSLGLIMYWVLNHYKMPFMPDGYANPEVKDKAMQMRLTGVAFPDLDVPADLNKILHKACAFKPEDRYQTAEEFRSALDRFASLEELTSPENHQCKPKIMAENLTTKGFPQADEEDPCSALCVNVEGKAVCKQRSFFDNIKAKFHSPPASKAKEKKIKGTDVFISYSSKEYITARQVRNVLTNNGISCWMAPESIPGGSDYGSEIQDGLENCRAFVLLLSTDSQNSKWVLRELDQAMSLDKVILPLHLDKSELSKAFRIRLTNVQRFEAYKKLSGALEMLVFRIKELTNPQNDQEE